MDLLLQIMESNNIASDQFEYADLMRKYKSVTESHGPSQALIDFVNQDNSFIGSIGVESFEQFSTPTQHEIILSNMNADSVDLLGLESLASAIDKSANWLMGVGAVGFFGSILATIKGSGDIKSRVIVGGISYGAFLTGAIVSAVNTKINGVFPQPAFHKVERAFDLVLSEDIYNSSMIPNGFVLDDWQNYYANMFSKHSESSEKWSKSLDAILDVQLDVKDVIPEKAGWTEKTFQEAGKWLINSTIKVHEEELKLAKKIESIEDFLNKAKESKNPEDVKVAKVIKKTIGTKISLFAESRDVINHAATKLDKVGKLFEEKK